MIELNCFEPSIQSPETFSFFDDYVRLSTPRRFVMLVGPFEANLTRVTLKALIISMLLGVVELACQACEPPPPPPSSSTTTAHNDVRDPSSQASHPSPPSF